MKRASHISWPLAATFLILGQISLTWARQQCFSIFDCEAKVRKGSECINGFCSNPYHRGGCLASRLPDYHRVRTCTSEDPPDSAELGYCQKSPLDYTEIRLGSQNWESVFFSSWIMQILLSELMDVPVTIETGVQGLNVDFYDLDLSFDYGKNNDYDAMKRSVEVKDCRKVENDPNAPPEDYKSCLHVINEIWTGQEKNLRVLQDEQIIETPTGIGALGGNGWYIPRFTAEHDPSLSTFIGLQGEKNRHKLAETFLRPTTWEDYCLYESDTQCQVPDSVATRPPAEEEKGLYFSGVDTFTGYFRNTTDNDCESWPENCTGHIVDFPCGWSSYVTQQTYHNKIAVKSSGKQEGSNGYSYGEMTQIWAAANATKSHLLMLWWEPEALYQQFIGTDAEFLRVNLPPPTQACVENRISSADRCSPDQATRVGQPEGACADFSHSLLKIIATSLREISADPAVPEAMHSPAYEAIKNYRITNLQLGQIFDFWLNNEKEEWKWSLNPRDAVCDWVIENLEEVRSFIPMTHPRFVEDNDHAHEEPIVYASFALAIVAICSTGLSIFMTYIQRNKKIMRYAQIEFLVLLLVGLLLVSLGALLSSVPATNSICVSVIWLINLGYTLELVPLIVKVAAISRLMIAVQQMRRVKLNLHNLYGAVVGIALLVTVMLTIWTATNPPRQRFDVTLTERTSEYGETIAERTYYCESGEDVWAYMAVAWQVLLLICASVLAFQTRKMRRDLNETQILAVLVYSHFVFVIFRVALVLIDTSVERVTLAAARSICYSSDVIAAQVIYFVPKFFSKDDNAGPKGSVQTTQSPHPSAIPPQRRKESAPHPRFDSRRSSENSSAFEHRERDSRPGTSYEPELETFEQEGKLPEAAPDRGRVQRSPPTSSFAKPIALEDNDSSSNNGMDYKTHAQYEVSDGNILLEDSALDPVEEANEEDLESPDMAENTNETSHRT